jgi:hypothetical protein
MTPDPAKLLCLYNDFTREMSGCSIRDEEYFRLFIEEFSAPGARLVFSENGCCAGYADGEEFYAFELFMKDDADPLSLLPDGFRKYVFPLPVNCEPPKDATVTVEEFSMIRPVFSDPASNGGLFYGFDKY